MPQVPAFVPEVQQQVNPVGGVRVNTPVEAFGGATARGLGELGAGLTHAGNELFQRAIALQQLDNDNTAKQADSEYMIKAGELHANYNALQGQDAVKAYPKYTADLKEARDKLRETLPNEMAKKMFDASSRSTMGRSIFNGAGHAAMAQKQYTIDTAKAQTDLDAKTVSDAPLDDVLFGAKLKRTEANATQIAIAKGVDPSDPQGKLLVAGEVSKLWANRIIGLSRTAPFEAQKMLEKNSSKMLEPDRLKVEQVVTSSGRAVGSANIAQSIYNAGAGDETTPPKSLADMEAEVRAAAKKQNPDDPLLETHAVAALKGIYNQDKYAKRQEELANKEIISQGIQSFGGATVQELRSDPRVAIAIDSLPKAQTQDLQGQINRFNAARDKKTQENAAIRLNGLSNNDVEAFLNTDITREPLSKGDMIKFMNLQAKLKKNPSGDPRVAKAVGILRNSRGAELEALGIYSRRENNKEDYDHFTGALQSAIEVWMADHGNKPPDAKTITDEIGPSVIRQRTEPSWFGLSSRQTPFYNQTVPESFSKQVKADVLAKDGYTPTDEEIYKAYVRKQYLEFYRKQPKVKDQGRVQPPISR